MHSFVFIAQLTPQRHIWIIGDDMLEKTANSLRKLKNQHAFDASKPELFIYKEYHVEAFHDSEVKPTYRNIMRKVRNNLTMALNKFPTVLPNYIIIVIDNSYMHDPAFIEFEMGTILKKVLNDVTRLLASRREQLAKKYRNTFIATEVFMTRPLPKPAKALTRDYQFKNARRNFNQLMDKLSKTMNFKPLNIGEINCSDKLLFNKAGDLSDFGQEQLWVSISQFIKERDHTRQLAVYKFNIQKEEVATQTPHEWQSQTAHHSVQQEARSEETRNIEDRNCPASRGRPWNCTEGDHHWDHWQGDRARFDSYHRQYDRDDYQDYYPQY